MRSLELLEQFDMKFCPRCGSGDLKFVCGGDRAKVLNEDKRVVGHMPAYARYDCPKGHVLQFREVLPVEGGCRLNLEVV